MTPRQFDLFIKRISAAIKESKFSSKDLVDQLLLSAVVEFVEEASFDSAFAQTHNRDFAQRISASMRNNVMALIAKQSYVNASLIKPFVGSALQKVIDKELANNNSATFQSNTNSPSSTNISAYAPSCCVCASKDKIITLLQCKHKMCSSCARKRFDELQYYTCSSCHAPVDIQALQAQKIVAARFVTDECCVCFDALTNKNRVFLSPCAHDMCGTCAKEMFINKNNTKCPLCRAVVEKPKVEKVLNTRLTEQ
jgi:hypothetical protein